MTYVHELEVLQRQVGGVASGRAPAVGAQTVVGVPLVPQALPQVLVELPPLLPAAEYTHCETAQDTEHQQQPGSADWEYWEEDTPPER